MSQSGRSLCFRKKKNRLTHSTDCQVRDIIKAAGCLHSLSRLDWSRLLNRFYATYVRFFASLQANFSST